MRRVAMGVALLVAACGSKTPPNEANGTGNAPAVSASNETSAANATANEAARKDDDLGTLPPANSGLRFLGTWAASEAECKTKPWRFTANGLATTDGPHCSFYKVTKAPGGYDIAAQCPTKEPVHTDLIELRFAESARAMLVESNAIKPTGLIYCGK